MICMSGNTYICMICMSQELAQVTSAIKTGQECMIGFCFGKENDSSRRVILKIELELKTENQKMCIAARKIFERTGN